ncbi:MAG: hypothetical protein AB7P46_17265 [Thermoanaerobaculia bacterium]
MRSALTSVALFVSMVLIGARDSKACICGGEQPLSYAVANHDTIFRGVAKSVEDKQSMFERLSIWLQLKFRGRTKFEDTDQFYERHGFRTTFVITEYLAGGQFETAKVFTGRTEGDCSFQFEAGQEYLVYARTSKRGKLVTDRCTRTKLSDNAVPEIEALRKELSGAASGASSNNSLERTTGLRPVAAQLMIR